MMTVLEIKQTKGASQKKLFRMHEVMMDHVELYVFKTNKSK